MPGNMELSDTAARLRRGDCSAPRRRLMKAMLGGALLSALPRQGLSHADFGPVAPAKSVPSLACVLSDGRTATLVELLTGRTTALQLMFTGCSAACPIQGATFARLQGMLPNQLARNIQLLSLSIDPLSDNPRALSAWLKRFDARPGWIAASPALAALGRVTALFRSGVNDADNHSTQVYLINRGAQLVWRTSDLPTPREIADLLLQLA
jgi:protein SCO1/2